MAKIKRPNPYDKILTPPSEPLAAPIASVVPKPDLEPVSRQVETSGDVRLNVILNGNLYRELRQHAFDNRETVSAVIRRLIASEMEKS
jgi:hypothetical protein